MCPHNVLFSVPRASTWWLNTLPFQRTCAFADLATPRGAGNGAENGEQVLKANVASTPRKEECT